MISDKEQFKQALNAILHLENQADWATVMEYLKAEWEDTARKATETLGEPGVWVAGQAVGIDRMIRRFSTAKEELKKMELASTKKEPKGFTH